MKSMNGAARRLLATIGDFTVAQKTLAVIGVAILALGGFALSSWLGRPTYSPLFTGLSSSDASGVVAQLQKDKVDYQLSDGGATILVPADKVDAERLAAASAGLPSSSTTGYSLLDTLGVTASDFQQNVTYKRAIEGELAKTIESIGGVASASVQLAIPQQSVYTQNQQDPTASVFINETTPLTTAQVQAIVHLVAAGYPGLKDTNVSVVDQKGETLSSVGGGAAGSASTQAADYEATTRTQVQTMLDRLLGPGNSTVTVSADISQSSGTKTTKTYTTPAKNPVLSQSSNTQTYTGAGAAGAASGVLGTDTTNGTTAANGTGTGTGGSYVSKQGVTNNAIDETRTTQTITPGTLNRQTIAVAVNSAALKVPTSTIQSLVAAAAGVNTGRGDSVTVAAASFSNAAAQSAKAALAQQQAAQSADNQSKMITAAIWVAGGLVALIVFFILLKKLFKRPESEGALDGGRMSVVPGSPAGDPLGGLDPTVRLAAAERPAELPTVAMPTMALPRQPRPDDASPFGQMRAEVDALAEADPEGTADYLRALMADRVAS
ncbi:flagellar basal-body MS-ring/collar protein FliF [Amnibacterium sp. CER49]|uniref:flagellar basal-body MS-ring/collar protein FliF n=1 Tax=Amnibacterium sp. CER49 TaxID=3039161 RepID=UPI00244AFA6B|nr:flagellar basal-body MS-ring/collar protein FliF [Amnibacterium sp. CER49]MDH2443854.1 flagellar basal-body MS-ring/collar protein FliF [Amnibacterium sp. CER49]